MPSYFHSIAGICFIFHPQLYGNRNHWINNTLSIIVLLVTSFRLKYIYIFHFVTSLDHILSKYSVLKFKESIQLGSYLSILYLPVPLAPISAVFVDFSTYLSISCPPIRPSKFFLPHHFQLFPPGYLSFTIHPPSVYFRLLIFLHHHQWDHTVTLLVLS